jgi:hypothetical protein
MSAATEPLASRAWWLAQNGYVYRLMGQSMAAGIDAMRYIVASLRCVPAAWTAKRSQLFETRQS